MSKGRLIHSDDGKTPDEMKRMTLVFIHYIGTECETPPRGGNPALTEQRQVFRFILFKTSVVETVTDLKYQCFQALM